MTTQRASNGMTNGHNGFRSDSEPDSPGTDSSDSVVNVNGITNGTSSLRINTRRKMNRKKSSPMMPAFMVSAPGKVIVFGEHSVVHGKVSALAEGRLWDELGVDISLWIGRSSCSHLATIVPPRHNALQVEAHSNAQVPRHRF
jgi:hypothetical protein